MQIEQRSLEKLKASEYWTPKTKDNGKSISPLQCPKCGRLNAWASSKFPSKIHCGHLNSCGAIISLFNLFPDLRQNVEKDYPVTKEDPERPAKEYLRMRGLEKSLEGLNFKYFKNVRKSGSGAVMFEIADGAWNGRLFNPDTQGKNHCKGEISGKFWKHPGIEYDAEKRAFVTEGIIDALSLIEMGSQAIALCIAGQDPSKVDLSGFKNLVFAFDNDEAGRKFTRKWMKAYPGAKAILPGKGDWNDLLVIHGSEYFEKNYGEYEFQASLAVAESAQEYAEIFEKHYGHHPGLFIFENCYYYTKEANKGLIVFPISDFTLNVDYFQLDESIPGESCYRYCLKVKPEKGRVTSISLSGSEIGSADSLTKAFLNKAKVLWKGDKNASHALAEQICESEAPVIRQLQILGHDKKSDCYIFHDFMIDAEGRTVNPDKHGFFKTRHNEYIRPPQFSNIKPENGTEAKNIYNSIY